MFALTFVTLLMVSALARCIDLDSRIFNGEEIGDELKFLVKLVIVYPLDSYICSGSILDTQWIITAAHCVSHPGSIIEARVTHFRSTRAIPALSIKKSNIFRHPKFIPSQDGLTVATVSVNVDLALLRTSQPIQYNHLVQPIPFGRYSPQQGPASVAGYGKPTFLPRKGQMILSYCPVQNQKPILCSVKNANMPRIGVGDSGGPVVANGVLVGIVSCYDTTPKSTFVDKFADIASNYDWIQSVIKMQH